MIPDKKLDFWIQNGYNVILRGRHGVGKTACIKEAFERNGLKWMYFSAATMDPWVDFIGVPKEKEENGVSYLELVRPKAFANDEVEALFFDEYNRSAAKIRNAVMELIQFKSINGKVFKNLKIVWAAINPDEKEEGDEELEYNVEPVDPAQLDRFHVIYDVPYSMDRKYFKGKYGERAASAAYSWWNDLDNKLKAKISPRRMDYAMDFFAKKGDLRDVLPKEANVQKLLIEIANGAYEEQLRDIYETADPNAMKTFITVENNFQNCKDLICKNDKYVEAFLPLLSLERNAALMADYPKVLNHVITNQQTHKQLIIDIITSNISKKIVKKLKAGTIVWKTVKTGAPVNLGVGAQTLNVSFQMAVDAIVSTRTFNAQFNKLLRNNSQFLTPSSAGVASPLTVPLAALLTEPQMHLTYYKMKYYNRIVDAINNSVCPQEAISIMEFIIARIGTMQEGTMQRCKHLEDLMVWCMRIIKAGGANYASAYNAGVAAIELNDKLTKKFGIRK